VHLDFDDALSFPLDHILAFFDLSSLRSHFWSSPFPSGNFGGRGKKVYGAAQFSNPQQYEGKTVAVSGKITLYLQRPV
jgi:hypothetical protein